MTKCGGYLGLATILLTLGLTGCSKKVPECNAMVAVINPAVETISRASAVNSQKGAEQAKSIRDMAGVLTKTADGLAKLELTTPELQKFSTEYQAMCKESATTANVLAELVASTEPKVAEAEAIQKSLSAMVDKFNSQCGAPKAPAECQDVGKKLQRAPSDLANAAQIDKFTAELSQVKVEDAALKATVATTIKSYRDGAALMKSLKDMEQKSEETSKSMNKSLDKESPLVDNLNAFCRS